MTKTIYLFIKWTIKRYYRFTNVDFNMKQVKYNNT